MHEGAINVMGLTFDAAFDPELKDPCGDIT